MTLSFKLDALPPQLPASQRCQPCDPETAPTRAQASIHGIPNMATVPLPKRQTPLIAPRRNAPMPVTTNELVFRFKTSAPLAAPVDPNVDCPPSAADPSNDQWSVTPRPGVNRFWQLCTAVLCVHRTRFGGHEAKGSVLGETGHIERASGRLHVAAAFAFAGYAISCNARFDANDARGGWAIAAAWTTAATFLSSAIYHCMLPDRYLSALTRQIDYIFVYMTIAVSAVADISAVTSGFVNVPLASVVDVPLSVAVLGAFFLYRRSLKSTERTEVTEFAGCTMGLGLLRRWHSDGEHSPLRQSTSLSISIFYFTAVPSVVQHGLNAALIIGLQAGAFGCILFGMLVDIFFVFPDRQIARGKRFALLNCGRRCGCVINSHAIWHITATIGAVLTATARELAIQVIV